MFNFFKKRYSNWVPISIVYRDCDTYMVFAKKRFKDQIIKFKIKKIIRMAYINNVKMGDLNEYLATNFNKIVKEEAVKNVSKKPKELILLCGKSGSGKDYLIKALGLSQVISHTERPMRKNEVNGVDKWFHEEGTYDSIKSMFKIIAHTKRGYCNYWTTKEDLKDKDVYIIDPPGIKYLKENVKDINFRVVYLDCPEPQRIINMKERGDSLEEIEERIEIENEDFKDIESMADFIVKK